MLKALGPRGHVVNISRGWAVDEAAVADALRNNVIEGAASTSIDEEPYEGTELLELDNLVMTPHFGGGTEHAQRRMTSLVCQNLDAHFAGKPVVSPVPELRDMAGVVKPQDGLTWWRPPTLPIHMLRGGHISEGPTLSDVEEAVEAMLEGDRPWRL